MTFDGDAGQHLSCQGQCDVTRAIDGKATNEFQATIRANGVPAGGPKSGQIRITVTIDGDTDDATRNVSVQPSAAESTVPEVSGLVVDVYTNAAIKGAKVRIEDSAAHVWDDVGTDDNGSFKIITSQAKPIAAGMIKFQVTKDGINPYETTKTAAANVALNNVRLTVSPINSPTPSSSAEPSLTASVNTVAGGPPRWQAQRMGPGAFSG